MLTGCVATAGPAVPSTNPTHPSTVPTQPSTVPTAEAVPNPYAKLGEIVQWEDVPLLVNCPQPEGNHIWVSENTDTEFDSTVSTLEVSLEEYLAYIQKLKDAGFTQYGDELLKHAGETKDGTYGDVLRADFSAYRDKPCPFTFTGSWEY